MTAARVAFRPRRRLRHLRAIQLHGPDFGDALGAGGVGQAFYRLSTAPAAPSENGGTLLYTSEKVDLTSQPEWDPVDIDWHALGRDAVHGAHSGRLRLSVFAVPGRPAAGGEACRDAEKVLDVVCDLNALPALGSGPTPSNTALIKLSDGWYCVPPERDDAEDAAKTAVVHKALWPKPSPPKEDAPANEDVDQGQSLAKEEGGLIRSFLPRRLWRHVPSFGHLNEAARSLSDYSDPETHSASAPSPRSSSPNQSTGAENGRSRGTRVYDVAERRADIRRLITARKALNDVVERHQRLQRYVSEMLAERKRRHDQMKELAELRQEAETYRRQSEVAQQHLESAAADYSKKRSSQCSNGAVMGEAARALKGACSRWQEAECVLQGENGLGQLRGDAVPMMCLISPWHATPAQNVYSSQLLASRESVHWKSGLGLPPCC
ncbi:unnamed protein product [Ostreobium quekettii]|uniref:Uncharacterized protein n=1 Tax=Ostreobium quekettii TaxID=121088 RepID=A0A8S1IRD1_9CHLO|nr:unnamed protein product [Ostreobium quekettii]